jgi:predicted alpha/beta hydrolase
MDGPIPPALRVVFLPAMGVAASYYEPFLARLQAAGDVCVVALDLPGQGSHPSRARNGHDYGYREVVEELIPEAIEDVAGQRPRTPVVLMGHSLGGQLALLSLASLAGRIDALVLVAAGTAHWRAWPVAQRWRAAMAVRAIAALSWLLPWYPGQRLGFGGNQARRFMRDWSCNARHGCYRLEGSERSVQHIEAQLESVRIPVHALTIAGDPVAPTGACEELLSLVPNALVTRHTVAAVPAHSPWRRHFSWAREPSDVEPAIARSLAAVRLSRTTRSGPSC